MQVLARTNRPHVLPLEHYTRPGSRMPAEDAEPPLVRCGGAENHASCWDGNRLLTYLRHPTFEAEDLNIVENEDCIDL